MKEDNANGTKQKCPAERELVLRGPQESFCGCYLGAAVRRGRQVWKPCRGLWGGRREPRAGRDGGEGEPAPQKMGWSLRRLRPPERCRPPWRARRPGRCTWRPCSPVSSGTSAELGSWQKDCIPDQLRGEDGKGAEVPVKAQTTLSAHPEATICPDVSSVGDLSPCLQAKGQRQGRPVGSPRPAAWALVMRPERL